MTLFRVSLIVAGCGAAALAFVLLKTPPGPRSLRTFDPDRIASLEGDMWQAYYRKENIRLFRDLIVTLHEQYKFSWAGALRTGFYLARAAASFATMTTSYERVIPDLERAFARVRAATDAEFEPSDVAKAELAWWVARRIPGQNSPEQVGRLIAAENALIFNAPLDLVLEASVLRARAGKLRDDGGINADWTTVSNLLHQSYQELHKAVN